MRHARRVSLTVLGVCAAVVVALAPAQADEGGLSIGHVQPGDGTLEVLVSVPPKVDLRPGDLQISVGGTTLNSTAQPADESGDSIRRTTILAIDTSASMGKRGRIAAAKEAAALFLETVPDDVYVGVVTFDAKVRTALAPTRDRDAARSVVAGLKLALRTRLNDGVIAAVAAAGTDGQRSILVLSDGRDTSKTPESDVATAIRDAEVAVDVVALDLEGSSLVPLQAMSEAGGGSVISADAKALEAAFSREADALARQVLVTAEMPDSITADEATVTVSLDTGNGVKTASAYAPVRDASTRPDTTGISSPDTSPLLVVSRPVMLGGVVAIGLGILMLLGGLVGGRKVAVSDAESRILAYGSGAGGVTGGGPRAEATQALTQVKQATGRMLRRNRGLEQRISNRLEAAGSALKPAEWLLLHGGIVMVVGLVGLLISGGNFVVMLLFVLGGTLVPWLWLGFRRKRRLKAFSGSLADTLQLVSGSLSAGLSLAQSIDTVVREGNEPIAGEFKRVLIESRLGVPIDECLESVADRMDSKDFAWVVMAIRIQREVGGNLAELLNTVAATLREREYLRRQVATLSAEGKMSAYILGGLPPAMVVYMLLIRRDYIMPIFTETLGLMMLAGACTMLAIGAFLMSKIVKVEV